MILAIARKDIGRTFRTPFAVIMMFVAPILITVLLHFAFSSSPDEEGDETITLHVLNLDEGSEDIGFNAGDSFLDILRSEGLQDLLKVRLSDDRSDAEKTVLDGKNDLLLVIPEDFSGKYMEGTPSLSLYSDPADSIVPRIGKNIIESLLTSFSYGQVLATTAMGLSIRTGETLTPELAEQLQKRLVEKLRSGDPDTGTGNSRNLSSPGESPPAGSQIQITALLMCAMIIFFAFFTGPNTAQTLVTEKEKGTLDRMAAAPITPGGIVLGKLAGVVLTLLIQVAVLIIFSTLFFRITWKSTGYLTALGLSLIISASGFGIFLMSLIKNSRQVGPMVGGVVSVTGMIGGLFSVSVPNLPDFMDTVSRAVPQGWLLQGFTALLSGHDLPILAVIVPIVEGILLTLLGIAIIRRRWNM